MVMLYPLRMMSDIVSKTPVFFTFATEPVSRIFRIRESSS